MKLSLTEMFGIACLGLLILMIIGECKLAKEEKPAPSYIYVCNCEQKHGVRQMINYGIKQKFMIQDMMVLYETAVRTNCTPRISTLPLDSCEERTKIELWP